MSLISPPSRGLPPQHAAQVIITALTTCNRQRCGPSAIAAEMLTRRDGHGSELIAQSWNVPWAATTASAPRAALTQTIWQ